ncbi:MAG: hypothetical protein KW788_02995 [Candidatus Doudnabacteria bacterium]|nr:hypothetical protein [Candidatus Doudnabacteria bacterium]
MRAITCNSKSKAVNSKQAGVTLLLAVLITAGLTLIALTISALTIQSIRNSRAVTLSEPAIGQAHSGAEEGVWRIKRYGTVANCDSPYSGEQSVSSDIYSARNYCQTMSPASFELSSNNPFIFFLYDPAWPNGVPNSVTGLSCSDGVLLDLSEMDNGGYSSMDITLPGSAAHNLSVYVTRLGGSAAGSPASYPIPVTVAPGGSISISSLLGPQGCGQDNRMQVKLVYWLGGTTGAETATVGVNTDIGMPGFPTIDSTGCAQKGAGSGNECTAAEIYSRKIEVTVPK